MSDSATATVVKPTARLASRRSIDRRFYTAVAVGAALIVLVGFARTYFLRPLFYVPSLSTLLRLHGFVTALWFVVFFLQVRLVAARRVNLHRQLGLVAALLVPTIFLLGIVVVVVVGRHGFAPDRPPAPYFVAMVFGNLIVFLALAAAGLYCRGRSDVHKRLMTLATLSLLTPAIIRIPLSIIGSGGFPRAFALTDLCMVACIAYDTWQKRRLHPAFGWGALFIVAAQPVRFVLSESHAWKSFVMWLLS
jgi:hypothetical protein